jgi:uncharacterized protein YifN (PemK superfamily)
MSNAARRNSLWLDLPRSHKVRPGEIYQCDFSDLLPPEMVKIRPVIVVSRSRLTSAGSTILVVPISSTPPHVEAPHHVELAANVSPWKATTVTSWAKCDMLYAVARSRLSFIIRRGKQFKIRLDADELHMVRLAASSGFFGGQLTGVTGCPCRLAALTVP